jgi:hypothetical protein
MGGDAATTATTTTTGAGAGGTGGEAGSGGEGGSGGAGGDPNLLTNESPCMGPEVPLAPSAGEEGHFSAARLTPSSYPFTVNKIRYYLAGDGSCTNGIAHQVMVFRGSDVAPAATPTVDAIIDVPAEAETASDRTVELDLQTPIQLTAGEHLFIAVEMAGDKNTVVLCTLTCMGNGIADRNYWSNATAAPFPWGTLDSFGINVNYRFEAEGLPE